MRGIPRTTAQRYVQPLREGGSLPAIVDTPDGLYVVKFRGAGQGPRALVAELVVGQIARALGLPSPELAIVELPEEFGRSEPDPEIQDLLRASHGENVGLKFLDGAFNFETSAAGDLVTDEFASMVVWLDAFTTNPDRTHRNPNLLVWNRTPWLIDHGAALYAHHNWAAVDDARTRSPFPLIEQHVLLRRGTALADADRHAVATLTADVCDAILAAVPDSLLATPGTPDHDMAPNPDALLTPDALRARYRAYLMRRIESPRAFVTEAQAAHERALAAPPRAVKARR